MLIVSRKIYETVRIGDDIEIKVVDIRNNRVRIGITAPKDTDIVRGELDYTKD